MVAGGAVTVGSLGDAPLSACGAGAPLPIPPDLLPKTAYDPVTPAFYVSLWDALNFLELVSASWALGSGPHPPPRTADCGWAHRRSELPGATELEDEENPSPRGSTLASAQSAEDRLTGGGGGRDAGSQTRSHGGGGRDAGSQRRSTEEQGGRGGVHPEPQAPVLSFLLSLSADPDEESGRTVALARVTANRKRSSSPRPMC